MVYAVGYLDVYMIKEKMIRDSYIYDIWFFPVTVQIYISFSIVVGNIQNLLQKLH